MTSPALLGRWRWRTHEIVASGATTRTIESPRVPEGQIRLVKRLAVQNADTANSILVLSVLEAGERIEVYYVKLVTAAIWYSLDAEIRLFPGEVLEYALTVCSASDDLYVREIGDVYEWTEEGPRSAAEIYAAGVKLAGPTR